MESAQDNSVRLDKYLFSIRYFKTRAQAAQAIDGGKVRVNDGPCKPAKALRVGDRIRLKRNGFVHEISVLVLLEKRANAEEAARAFALVLDPDLSDQARALKAVVRALPQEQRRGRPSKKERRDLDRLLGE
jgi:ribosome-associated heat shock protein Hsp15